MPTSSSTSLYVFISTQLINCVALASDYLLIKNNLTSITAISVQYPVIGATLCLIQTIYPISLAIHFINFKADGSFNPI